MAVNEAVREYMSALARRGSAKLTKEQRKARAVKAVRARWKKYAERNPVKTQRI